MSDPVSSDHEWLEARERGESVEHISPEVRKMYANLERHLATLPPEGWQDRVLAQIDALEAEPVPPALQSPGRRPARRTAWIVGSVVAAAAVVLIVYWLRPRADGQLAIEIEPTASKTDQYMGGPSRDRTALAGDTLHVRLTRSFTEVRVYPSRGSVIARCPGAHCTDGVIDLVLEGKDSLEVLGFSGCTPPAPRVDRADDEAKARDAHCEASQRVTITVH